MPAARCCARLPGRPAPPGRPSPHLHKVDLVADRKVDKVCVHDDLVRRPQLRVVAEEERGGRLVAAGGRGGGRGAGARQVWVPGRGARPRIIAGAVGHWGAAQTGAACGHSHMPHFLLWLLLRLGPVGSARVRGRALTHGATAGGTPPPMPPRRRVQPSVTHGLRSLGLSMRFTSANFRVFFALPAAAGGRGRRSPGGRRRGGPAGQARGGGGCAAPASDSPGRSTGCAGNECSPEPGPPGQPQGSGSGAPCRRPPRRLPTGQQAPCAHMPTLTHGCGCCCLWRCWRPCCCLRRGWLLPSAWHSCLDALGACVREALLELQNLCAAETGQGETWPPPPAAPGQRRGPAAYACMISAAPLPACTTYPACALDIRRQERPATTLQAHAPPTLTRLPP